MLGIFIAASDSQPEKLFSVMDSIFRTMTEKAALGECAWCCSDCCTYFPDGMPDKCPHNCQRCTDIIQRDKVEAQSKVDDCGRALS